MLKERTVTGILWGYFSGALVGLIIASAFLSLGQFALFYIAMGIPAGLLFMISGCQASVTKELNAWGMAIVNNRLKILSWPRFLFVWAMTSIITIPFMLITIITVVLV